MKLSVFIFFCMFSLHVNSQNHHCKGYNECADSEVIHANAKLNLSNSEIDGYEELHVPFGKPIKSGTNNSILLIQEEFVICYDTLLTLPVWVSYLLTKDWADDEMPRCDCFRDDPRLYPNSNQNTCKIYSGSGYNRGHLAPRDDFNRSKECQLNTYIFSNIVPQTPEHNQTTWRYLEGYINDLAEKIDSIYVLTGIIFDYDGDGEPDNKSDIPTMGNNKPLTVASDFYKIVLKKNDDGSFDALSIITPHDEVRRKKYESLGYVEEKCLSSIDIIEKASGYNFFWQLDNQIEDILEAKTSIRLW